MAEYYAINGSLPDLSDISMTTSASTAYSSVAVTSGVVKVEMNPVGGLTDGQFLEYVPDVSNAGTVTWLCTAAAGNTDIPYQYLPSACQA